MRQRCQTKPSATLVGKSVPADVDRLARRSTPTRRLWNGVVMFAWEPLANVGFYKRVRDEDADSGPVILFLGWGHVVDCTLWAVVSPQDWPRTPLILVREFNAYIYIWHRCMMNMISAPGGQYNACMYHDVRKHPYNLLSRWSHYRLSWNEQFDDEKQAVPEVVRCRTDSDFCIRIHTGTVQFALVTSSEYYWILILLEDTVLTSWQASVCIWWCRACCVDLSDISSLCFTSRAWWIIARVETGLYDRSSAVINICTFSTLYVNVASIRSITYYMESPVLSPTGVYPLQLHSHFLPSWASWSCWVSSIGCRFASSNVLTSYRSTWARSMSTDHFKWYIPYGPSRARWRCCSDDVKGKIAWSCSLVVF